MLQPPVKMRINFLFAVASVLSLCACGQPEPISYESLVLVNNYYIRHPVASLSATAGGWLFRGARDYGREIRIGFLVPEPMSTDRAIRKALLTSLCPARSAAIWQALPHDNKLVINVWTEDNKFKDSVTC